MLALIPFLAGCSSSHHVSHPPGKITVRVAPGTQKTFAPGALLAGDTVRCGRGGFGAVVQRPGSAVSAGGSRTPGTPGGNIQIQNNGDGTVVVKCTR